MRRRIARLGIALLTVALVAAVSPTTAAAAGSGAAVERPWMETASGTITSGTGDCDVSGFPVVACPSSEDLSLTGTHVGRASLTGVGTGTIDFSQTCLTPDGLSGNPYVSTYDEVIVAADGSELHAHSVNTGCLVEFGLPTAFTGTRTITGGTGRFEGATGSVAFSGVGIGDAIEGMAGHGTITY